MVPQTDTSAGSFTGKYVIAAQGFNGFCCEFDFVGQGAVTAGVLSATGMVSDPFLTLNGASATNTGVKFSGTPQADTGHVGRYTMFSTNSTPNPFHLKIKTANTSFDVALYQASGGQLFWIDEGTSSVFLGSLLQQGSLTEVPAARRAAKTKSK